MPKPLCSDHIESLVPYVPGKPIEETEREYGITDIAKLASNENCLGPSKLAVTAMTEAVHKSHLYPDAGAYFLKERFQKRHPGFSAAQFALGNGTNELLTLCVRAFVGEGESVMTGWPSFVVYRLAAHGLGRKEVAVPLTEDLQYDFDKMAAAIDDSVKLIFLANPNNPTGRYFSDDALKQFLDKVPSDVIVVLDEAYAEYVDKADYPDGSVYAASRPRTIVTRTFSKIFGLASLRVGYAFGDEEVISVLNRLRDPFNVNHLAQVAAIAALDDDAHVEASRKHNTEALGVLTRGLEDIGVEVTPSVANFVLMHLDDEQGEIPELYEALLQRGVIIRPVKGYGLPKSARVTAGSFEENARFLTAIAEVLEERS